MRKREKLYGFFLQNKFLKKPIKMIHENLIAMIFILNMHYLDTSTVT